MNGYNELLNKVTDILKTFNHSYYIKNIENGWEIFLKDIPNKLRVSCFKPMGWNICVIMTQDEIGDTPELDLLYSEINEVVIDINEFYYELSSEQKEKYINDLNEIKEIIDKEDYIDYLNKVKIGSYKVHIEFIPFEEHSPSLTLEYIPYSDIWYSKNSNLFIGHSHNIIPELYNIFQELTLLIDSINTRNMNLSF